MSVQIESNVFLKQKGKSIHTYCTLLTFEDLSKLLRMHYDQNKISKRGLLFGKTLS